MNQCRVLIIGKNSYVGTSVYQYLSSYCDDYILEFANSRNDAWKEIDFSKFDVVFNAAGLCHADSKHGTAQMYFDINTKLPINIAKKAKAASVKQFIHMSSMIVYGKMSRMGKEKYITASTVPTPENVYGTSKLEAENGLKELADSEFKVAIIRAPLIYGENAKDNFPRLVKFAHKLHIFPKIKNYQSIIYIDNFCELVNLIIQNQDEGVFYPQDKEYIETSKLVKDIAEVGGHKILLTRIFNPILYLASSKIYFINKAFGSITYDSDLSNHYNWSYCKVSYPESIIRICRKYAQKKAQQKQRVINKTIQYCAVTTVSTNMDSFVIPAMEELRRCGYDVTLVCNMSDDFAANRPDYFKYIPINIERGFHFFSTLKSIFALYKIFRKNKIDMVQYGTENAAFCASIASFFAGVPVRIYEHWGARYIGYTGLKKIVSGTIEWTAAFFSTDVRQVSPMNMEMCVQDHIYRRKKAKVLGRGGTVGVDLETFDVAKKYYYSSEIREKYGINANDTVFGYVGRIHRDKGLNELFSVFRYISDRNTNCYLIVVGTVDIENPIDFENMGWALNSDKVIFTGGVRDVYRYIAAFDIMVHPTYREGFGMVLQEAAAMKVPIITTNIMGPAEFVQNNKTGILVEKADEEQLMSAMYNLMNDKDLQNDLAEKAFDLVQREFDRKIMVKRIADDRNELMINSIKRILNYRR